MLSDDRKNNFGVLRLLFANLVVYYHSYFLIDGDAHRDIFHKVPGAMPVGTLAVAGFFLISGYLVVKSYTNSVSVKDYLVKRFLRIWPGYAVAFLISLLVVAPLGGAKLADINVLRNVSCFLTFQAPCIDRVFYGLSVEKVNGSLWTISYEVRCYVLVILLGACGFLHDRRKFLVWTVCLGLAVFLPLSIQLPFSRVFGALSSDVLLTGLFCAGGVFYLYRDRIRVRVGYAVIALPIWLALQFNVATAQIALMTAGAYILFYVATREGDNLISRFVEKTDLSYGIYLYAYPIQQLILWRDRNIGMYKLLAISVVCAGVAGAVSWYVVERPALGLKPRSVHRELAPAATFGGRGRA
jgi:peptidoglycan/LPS O-acetylase OafA/YrhL